MKNVVLGNRYFVTIYTGINNKFLRINNFGGLIISHGANLGEHKQNTKINQWTIEEFITLLLSSKCPIKPLSLNVILSIYTLYFFAEHVIYPFFNRTPSQKRLVRNNRSKVLLNDLFV